MTALRIAVWPLVRTELAVVWGNDWVQHATRYLVAGTAFGVGLTVGLFAVASVVTALG